VNGDSNGNKNDDDERDVESEFFKAKPLDNFDRISNTKSSNSLKFKKLERTHSGGEISYENKANDFNEDTADDVDDLNYSNKILSQSLSIGTGGDTKLSAKNASISNSSLSKSNKIRAKSNTELNESSNSSKVKNSHFNLIDQNGATNYTITN
jgi:hypothetical protein